MLALAAPARLLHFNIYCERRISMKTTVNHPIHGEIVYTETAFLGKKSITVNGVEAVAISKKEFMIDGKHATLKGSFLLGATLCLEGESIEVCPKPHGYEIFLAVVPFLILLIWGNVPALCTIFPVVGGMIGGALYGVGAVLSLFLMKKASKAQSKILIGLGVFALTALISFIIACVIITAIVASEILL